MLNDLTTCRICFNNQASIATGHGDIDSVKCMRCGEFTISGEAKVNWQASQPTKKQQVNAAGWIRDHQGIRITRNEVESLLVLEPLTVAERADKLLLALVRKFPRTGQEINIPFGHPNALEWHGISWSEDDRELIYLLHEYLLVGEGLLQYFHSNRPRVDDLQVSAKGYRYIEKLRQQRPDATIGFCAMWFDERVRPIWTDAIEPAIGDARYTPKRIDNHEHNNRIDDEIMAMIRQSKFVVADFMGNRGGIYFEAGFALGLGIPVIWTCRASRLHRVHFDNRQYSFVTWEPDQLPNFKARLQNRIEATIGRGPL